MWHSFGWLPALVFLIITLGETACVLQVGRVTVSAGTGVKLTVSEMLLWSHYAKQPTPSRILLYLAFLPTEVSFQVDLHPPFILFLNSRFALFFCLGTSAICKKSEQGKY